MDFTCSCDFYCFSLFSQILNIEMLQTSLINLLDVCFHSRWNIFYTRFWGLDVFRQILSLHLSLHVGKKIQIFLRRAPNLSDYEFLFDIGKDLNPWPSKSSLYTVVSMQLFAFAGMSCNQLRWYFSCERRMRADQLTCWRSSEAFTAFRNSCTAVIAACMLPILSQRSFGFSLVALLINLARSLLEWLKTSLKK